MREVENSIARIRQLSLSIKRPTAPTSCRPNRVSSLFANAASFRFCFFPVEATHLALFFRSQQFGWSADSMRASFSSSSSSSSGGRFSTVYILWTLRCDTAAGYYYTPRPPPPPLPLVIVVARCAVARCAVWALVVVVIARCRRRRPAGLWACGSCTRRSTVSRPLSATLN